MTHKGTYRGRTIPIGCTAVFHHDEDGYAERGYHLLKYWPLDEFWPDIGRPVPNRRRPAQIATYPSMSLKETLRPSGKGDMTATLIFKCSCGERKHANSRELLEIAERLLQEFGSRAWVPIQRL